jgi:hypothetical protein
MDWVMIRVPVPREFLLQAEPDAADDERMVLHPRLMGRLPLTLGEYDLGEWTVTGIEMTMEKRDLTQVVGDRLVTPLAPSVTVPTYWATLTRPVR